MSFSNFSTKFTYFQTTTGIDGKTWALCEETSENYVSGASKADPPAIVTQHSDLPRKFVLLSAQVSKYSKKTDPLP